MYRQSFEAAIDTYVEANSDWLMDSDTPLVSALYKAAEALDRRVTASLLGEFRQLMRELHRRKPGLPKEQIKDEFDTLVAQFS